MKTGFILVLFCAIFKKLNAVVIDPDSNDPFITAVLTNDPRGINTINGDNEWELEEIWDNSLGDWYIKIIIYILLLCM